MSSAATLHEFCRRFSRGWKTLYAGDPRTALEGASSNSKKVEPGFVFFALKGARSHGVSFAKEVLERGAAAVLVEAPTPVGSLNFFREVKSKRPPAVFSISGLRGKIGEMSNWIYGDPSARLPVVAVTGTNGKTTVCYMLESIAAAQGKKSGVLGTVNCRVAGKIYPASLTTPQADELFGYLSAMKRAGCSYAFIEATSQALDLGRLEGLKPAGAVFTNLTRDHLDFHKTMPRYFQAKEALFKRLLKNSPWKRKFAAVNADSEWGRQLLQSLSRGAFLSRIAFGVHETPTEVSAENIFQSFEGVSFVLDLKGARRPVRLPLIGRHNVSNALAAASAALGLSIPVSAIVRGLENLSPIPGRLEKVPAREDLLVLVDYAHTDDALRNVLAACREIPQVKRLVVVFGCGGDRDPGKRPLMGKTAVEWADWAVVTSDNPRSEDPVKIIRQIEAGIKESGKTNYVAIPDRSKAIAWAIQKAQPGDCVLIAGKGHETYQILGSRTIHFDDREVAASYLKKRSG